MLREITIESFRALKRLKLGELGRINLLVGMNNCGKTSVLEAIEALVSRGDFPALLRSAGRRGEVVWDESESRVPSEEADICHLFTGHTVDIGSSFSIRAENDSVCESLTAMIIASEDVERQTRLFSELPEDVFSPLALSLQWVGKREGKEIYPITRRGGVPLQYFRRGWARPGKTQQARLITTSSMMPDEVIKLFERIVLTEQEDLVVEALRLIDPSIERIATVRQTPGRFLDDGRGGFVVKLKNVEQRVPIGSMGDGIWRMLGLTLALVRAEGGVVLVDEIDTGLHYSVMKDMWRLVAETAERLDVQVFATTHSRDCYESLATTIRDEYIETSVTIQRLEKGNEEAVHYLKDEIIAAAERSIEVR